MTELPKVGSLWEFPGWNNPDFTGAWQVTAVGVDDGYELDNAVELRRLGGRQQVNYTAVDFWPGGWVPVNA